MNGYVLIERGVNKCVGVVILAVDLLQHSPVLQDIVAYVNAHNARESTFKLSYAGPFADQTSAEYQQTVICQRLAIMCTPASQQCRPLTGPPRVPSLQ